MLPALLPLLSAVVLLIAAPVLETSYDAIMSTTGFLTMHNVLEIAGVIAYFAIFLVAFYTYGHDGSLKVILLGSLLLAAGIVTVFHLLSYKGMPAFLVENTTANRATTFWIAARLISVIGFLVSAFVKDEKRSNVNRYYFMLAALLISAFFLTAATYFPDFLPAMYVEGMGLTPLKKLLEYFIILMLAIAAVKYLLKFFKKRRKMLFTMFSALLLSTLSEFAFTIYINVYGVYNFIGHVLCSVSLYMIFNVVFSKTVLAPYIALTAAQKELRDHADNLDRLVAQRTGQLREINERLLEDLEYAHDLQRSMLPSFLPDTPHIGFSSIYSPAERLSGDFYDVFMPDENHICFYICDVSGHGVPAAMLTVFVKQCIDGIIETDRGTGAVSRPSEVLTATYDTFNNSNFGDEVYIALIYLVYDLRNRRLLLSSAGMNEMPFLTNVSGETKSIFIKGIPICKLKGVSEAAYTDMELAVKKGDRLVLYTDGLVEMRDEGSSEYSAIRLKKLIEKSLKLPLSEQAELIENDIKGFSNGRKPKDDITLLAVEFR